LAENITKLLKGLLNEDTDVDFDETQILEQRQGQEMNTFADTVAIAIARAVKAALASHNPKGNSIAMKTMLTKLRLLGKSGRATSTLLYKATLQFKPKCSERTL
jgi:glutaminase